ncbi:MAG TPA: hypothetical protein VF508_05235 [Pyrinomonadaceae bacterium]|jgi:hypothetical protein
MAESLNVDRKINPSFVRLKIDGANFSLDRFGLAHYLKKSRLSPGLLVIQVKVKPQSIRRDEVSAR